MMVRDLGDGGRWFVVAVHYPSALQAKRAWERINAKLDMRAGDEGIGIVRMSPAGTGSPSGAPPDTHAVVGVSLHKPTARKMERLARDGTAWEPLPDFADAVILRRARVVVATDPARTGRVVIRRPEGRGAQLDQSGVLYEPEGGQG